MTKVNGHSKTATEKKQKQKQEELEDLLDACLDELDDDDSDNDNDYEENNEGTANDVSKLKPQTSQSQNSRPVFGPPLPPDMISRRKDELDNDHSNIIDDDEEMDQKALQEMMRQMEHLFPEQTTNENTSKSDEIQSQSQSKSQNESSDGINVSNTMNGNGNGNGNVNGSNGTSNTNTNTNTKATMENKQMDDTVKNLLKKLSQTTTDESGDGNDNGENDNDNDNDVTQQELEALSDEMMKHMQSLGIDMNGYMDDLSNMSHMGIPPPTGSSGASTSASGGGTGGDTGGGTGGHNNKNKKKDDQHEVMGQVMDGMMKQLLSKEFMYEPIRDICTRYPSWLAEHKSKLSEDEYQRYGTQYQYFQRIVHLYNHDPDNISRLTELMNQLQEYGQPPSDLVSELAPDLEFDKDGMPKMDGMGMNMMGNGNMPMPMPIPGMNGDEDCSIM